MSVRTKIIVAVCTYHRNEPLTKLLISCAKNAEIVSAQASVGVVIVDDSSNSTARPVSQAFEKSFELGLDYISSASGNISVARNLALENAAARGDYIAMTDDDCEPNETWLRSLLSSLASSAPDVVTGLMLRRPDAPAPTWLIDQGFLTLGEFNPKEGEDLEVAFTNNCLICSSCILKHRDLRFDERLGKIGGEDMVFFMNARKKGLRIAFSQNAIVYENEPAERLTFRYQLWRYYWHGNSSVVTQIRNGVSRPRMFIHGGMSLLRAMAYSPRRTICNTRPQFRMGAALTGEALGKLLGSLGVEVKHH